MKSERDGINPAAKPSGTGCVECSAGGGWWFHLRRCAECGHIGCCDTSPNQHASKHNAATGHPIITSFEPSERWFYDYRTGEFFAGPKLHAPHSHQRAMQRLDCIGGVDHFADAWRKGKERGDVLPGSAPGRPNRRVAFAPLGLDQANELPREKEGAKI